MKQNLLKAVLYARVSTKEQEDTGYSLPSQVKFLNDYARKKNMCVKKIYDVSESASGKKLRATFSDMMDYIKKNKIKIIICEKADRLSRNFKDMVLIDEWLEKDEERQIHLVKDSLVLHSRSRSQEKLNWGIRMLFAKNYIDNLSEEVKKGQIEKLKQGWLPSTPPLGYKTIGEKGRKIHIVDEKKAPVIKKMYKIYSKGNHSLKRLTEILIKDGLKNRHDKPVSRSQVHSYLNNPFYTGKIIWKGKEYEGKHEPLISQDLWGKVQDVLHKKGTPIYQKHNFIFRGLFKCSECGGVIAWEKQRSHWYGHCNRHRPCSQKDFYRYEHIQNQLLKEIDKITPKSKKLIEWVVKALKASHQDEIVYHNSVLSELNNRLSKTKNRLDKIYDDKLDEEITEKKYRNLKHKYEKDEKEAIKAIERHKTANSKYYDFGVLVLEVTKQAKTLLSDIKKPDELKREYYNIIFNKLEITGNTVDLELNKAFKLIADFNSKIENISNSGKIIFEHQDIGLDKRKTGTFVPVRSAVLAYRDSFRTFLCNVKTS
ncbi:recombinase family protein [Candidatus Parcubacteria bacterium]|nr:recombinase family protein [Candidatus Parcubacteria bacterium]